MVADFDAWDTRHRQTLKLKVKAFEVLVPYFVVDLTN